MCQNMILRAYNLATNFISSIKTSFSSEWRIRQTEYLLVGFIYKYVEFFFIMNIINAWKYYDLAHLVKKEKYFF